MKEYSCDYRVYTRKIYIICGKLKNFKDQLLCSNALFLCRHEDTSSLHLLMYRIFMPTQKQSVATQQLIFKVFKFTAYYVNFPSIYTIVT